VASSHVLMLGPFHGQPAVVMIPIGKGVCGTGVLEYKTQVVADCHNHPNHIACDPLSRSEIVVPLMLHPGSRKGQVEDDNDDGKENEAGTPVCLGVLDIDSPVLFGFDAIDAQYLEQLVGLVIAACDWSPVTDTTVALTDKEVSILKSGLTPPSCSIKTKHH
jgi:L-methionine (R)-S-oxide reductase